MVEYFNQAHTLRSSRPRVSAGRETFASTSNPIPSARRKGRFVKILNVQETSMLSLDQCIDFCGLSEEEVELIAEHEGVPEIVAAQMACQWLNGPQGVEKVRCVLLDQLEHARGCGDTCKARRIQQTLVHFSECHRSELTSLHASR